MRKERFSSLSRRELRQIAAQGHLLFPDDIKTEDLARLVYEAIEEERFDKRDLNNTLCGELHKYEIAIDSLEWPDAGRHGIKERYNSTYVRFLRRDPSWGYVYWGLNNDHREELLSKKISLYLRVVESKDEDNHPNQIISSFIVPILLSDERRYVNLSNEDHYYCVELCSEESGGKLLARSNIIYSSRYRLLTEKLSSDNTIIMELSGLIGNELSGELHYSSTFNENLHRISH